MFNSIYLLGDDFVLRVPPNTPLGIAAMRDEALVVPLARAVGIRAPALVLLDDTCQLLPVPYTVYERVHGVPFQSLTPDLRPSATWPAIGHDLARLHTGINHHGPAGQLGIDQVVPDPRPWLDELVGTGLVLASEAQWMVGWLDRLEPFVRAPVPSCFCHGDVNASNIMVHEATYAYLALLDWGGAGWGDAAWDFAHVALDAVPRMLAGYRATTPLPLDETAEARILWYHLYLAIVSLRYGPPRPRTWTEQRLARLESGIQRFLEHPTAQWMTQLA
jgi:aminoglycoside phosphotransferase (APT) family kinase protein